jgi:RNase P/RNase MRP subunit POP5
LLKRVKRRYLALEVYSPETFSPEEFMDTVWDAVSRLYGEHGASQTSLSLISFDESHKSIVLRTGHTTVEMIRTALTSITHIGDQPAAVYVLTVSGTIKALHAGMKRWSLKGLS